MRNKMKKLVALLIIICFVITIPNKIEGRAEEISIKFEEAVVNEEGDWAEIDVGCKDILLREGYPMLPYKTRVITFPFGTKIKSVEVKTGGIITKQLNKKIQPAPPAIPLNMENVEVEAKEGSIYESNEAYPANWVEYNTGAGIENGKHVIFLSIHAFPCRYIPAKNELMYINEMKIKVNYEPPEKMPIQNDVYDLLIIAPSEFSDALQPLVEHKESHGVKTKLVTLNEIYNGAYFATQGRDDAEKVKYFIKNAIEQWGIKYVLLVGGRKPGIKEEWFLPVRYAYLNDRSSSWEYERRFISDLYFADIYDANGNFSTWDSNNNGYYGEYDHETNEGKKTDDIDLYPDVAIGRLPCRNRGEVKRVVDKICMYEETPKNGWFNNLILCGGDSYPNDPCGNIAEGEYLEEEIIKQMPDFHPITLYPSTGLNMKTISDAINEGAGFAVFEGAGAHHLWATHPYDDEKWIYYYNWNIRLLNNKQKLPIVLTSGARLAQFNQTKECFNWMFVKARYGAIASIGSTGLCWTGHGKNVTSFYLGNLHVRLFKEYSKTKVLGEIWRNAITGYLNAFEWHHGVGESFHIKAAEELILFGDPTLYAGNFAATSQNNGRVLHVGGSGPGNYTSIQMAINDSLPGDTIFVYSGVYGGDIIIPKTISLLGERKEDTIIQSNGDGITIFAPSVKIENFTIQSTYKKQNVGIKGLAYKEKIVNVSISSYAWGIWLINASESNLKDAVFSKNEYALLINNCEGMHIIHNIFDDNWYGVWSENSPNLSIRKNLFYRNRWYSLWLDASGGSNIINNSFERNWYSIYLYNCHENFIARNEFLRNEHGPQFVNADDNIFIRNNVEGNEHYGIYIGWRSEGNRITKNNFIENAQNARDDYGSTWDANYWSDYIGIKWRIFAIIGLPYHIPGRFNQWDWHPQLTPY